MISVRWTRNGVELVAWSEWREPGWIVLAPRASAERIAGRNTGALKLGSVEITDAFRFGEGGRIMVIVGLIRGLMLDGRTVGIPKGENQCASDQR
jgi:hypothetical protein